MSCQEYSGSPSTSAGLSGLQSAFSEALEELEGEAEQRVVQPEVTVPDLSLSPDELCSQENLPGEESEEEPEEQAHLPTMEFKHIEDEQDSEYAYTCYEKEPQIKRNQTILGLKIVHKQHDLTRGRYPTLPTHPDHIDKVFGFYDYWTALPRSGFRSGQDESDGQGDTAFCQYEHKRLQLSNVEERRRWLEE